jgi:uncharacterized Zn finger protein
MGAAQNRPPLCPKCGSHKTEVVGRSNDLSVLHVRCTACGTRSEVSKAETAAVAAR